MIVQLREWILNIVTLVMLIVFLELLIPTGKFKKLVNLVSGFILIIAIISPVLGFFKGGINLKEFQIADKLELSKKELEASKMTYSDSQMILITSTYKKSLVQDIEQSVAGIKGIGSVKAEVIVEEDSKSSDFGKIKRVIINASEKNEKEIVKPVSIVGTITIKNSEASVKDSNILNGKQALNNLLTEEIKNKISKSFQVSEDIIAVNKIND